MHGISRYSILLIPLLAWSCFKKDDRIAPELLPPSYTTITIPNPYTIYTYNSYLNLDSGKIVKISLQADWDLAFDCSPAGWHVLVNPINSKEIARTGGTDFTADYTSATSGPWLFDASSGNTDSMAIDPWVLTDSVPYRYTKQVYLLGTGQSDAYTVSYKLQFIQLTDSSIVFLAAAPGATLADTITIRKNPAYRYIFYSFSGGGKIVDVEPPKAAWDIVMGSYQTMLYTTTGIPTPYIVRGVLSNTPGVECLRVADANYWNFGISDLQGLTFSDAQDAVGWEWKDLQSRDNALYRIVPDLYYIIKTRSGKYVKLLFLSYTNSNAENGYPLFVVGKLD